jgi:hypothetical protein
VGEDVDQLLLHDEVLSGIVMGTLHGDQDRDDVLSFIAGARNGQEAEVQLLTLYPGALSLHLRDATLKRCAGGNAAAPLLPCRGGLYEEGGAFDGAPAIDTSENLGCDRTLLGGDWSAKQFKRGNHHEQAHEKGDSMHLGVR